MIDLNATQAAIRAGYSVHTAQEQSSRLLSNVMVARAIESGKTRIATKLEFTAERVLKELARLVTFDVRKLYNADGSMKHPTELDDDTAAALAQIEVMEEFEGVGAERELIGLTKKVKTFDKNTSITTAMKYFGLLVDRKEVRSGPLAAATDEEVESQIRASAAEVARLEGVPVEHILSRMGVSKASGKTVH